MSRQFADTGQETDGSVYVAQDVYLVSGLTLGDNPIVHPTVPAIGTPHPTIPNARVDRVQLVEWLNGTQAKVGVLYSSDLRGRLIPRVRDDDPSFVSYAFSVAPVNVDVPVFERETYSYESGDPPTVTSEYRWREREKTMESVETVFTLVYNVNAISASQVATIEGQANKIHTLGSSGEWKFRAGNSTRITATQDQLRLEWTRSGELPPWPIDNEDPPRWVGPPRLRRFEQYLRIASPATGQPPSIITVDLWDRVPNGWQLLPGPPPL